MIDKYINECTDYDFKVNLEIKKSKSWLKSISAFSNGIGGMLLFGVDDNRNVIGIDNSKFVSDKITELINSKIKPPCI